MPASTQNSVRSEAQSTSGVARTPRCLLAAGLTDILKRYVSSCIRPLGLLTNKRAATFICQVSMSRAAKELLARLFRVFGRGTFFPAAVRSSNNHFSLDECLRQLPQTMRRDSLTTTADRILASALARHDTREILTSAESAI